MELISRQAAIDVVAKQYRYESDRMTALQEVPIYNFGWIPVSERLPETNRQVLAQWELSSRIYNTVSVYTEIMRWNGEMWISDKGVPVGQTVAWMPLPAPYRPEPGKE